MKPLRISRPDQIALALLVPIAVIATIATALYLPATEGDPRRQPSTFFNAAYGTKAAYVTLERLGYDVRRHRSPLDEASLAGTDVLFLLRPVEPLKTREQEALLDWVATGHTLVIAPSATEDLSSWFRYGSRPSSRPTKGPPRRATRAKGLTSDQLLRGVNTLETRSDARFHDLEPVTGSLGDPRVVWSDDGGAVALRIAHDEGQIVALAATDFLENAGLDRADHPALLVNLVELGSREGARAEVAFEETHLGFEERDISPVAMAKLVVLSPYRYGLMQALAVGFLFLAGRAVRFGAPRDEAPITRRKQSELVRAAARLFADARSSAYIQQKIFRHYRARLCRLVHLHPSSGDRPLAAAIHERTGLSESDILHRLTPAPGEDIVYETRQLHHLTEILSHGNR